MTKPDLALSQIAARFTRHDVEWSRGAFMIIDRRTANPIARLRRRRHLPHRGSQPPLRFRRQQTAVCQPSAVCGQRNERTDDQPRALKQLRHEASLSLA